MVGRIGWRAMRFFHSPCLLFLACCYVCAALGQIRGLRPTPRHGLRDARDCLSPSSASTDDAGISLTAIATHDSFQRPTRRRHQLAFKITRAPCHFEEMGQVFSLKYHFWHAGRSMLAHSRWLDSGAIACKPARCEWCRRQMPLLLGTIFTSAAILTRHENACTMRMARRHRRRSRRRAHDGECGHSQDAGRHAVSRRQKCR